MSIVPAIINFTDLDRVKLRKRLQARPAILPLLTPGALFRDESGEGLMRTVLLARAGGFSNDEAAMHFGM